MKHITQVVPFEPLSINPTNWPRYHEPGALKAGDSVWYRDQRYWIESAPSDWTQSCMVRISSERFLPGAILPENRLSFAVHADHLTLAPTTKNRYGRQPTKKAVDRREKQKQEGVRDNGDTVAIILRSCTSLDDVYKTASKHLGVPESTLREKYAHLNNGQQRMNLGNRLRGAHKAGLLKLN
jgi:hypothetical protein